jgi:hypothetical protein
MSMKQKDYSSSIKKLVREMGITFAHMGDQKKYKELISHLCKM